MADIDERVVEMKFRREDFLKGTEETLNALERIETSLSGANGISNGLQRIGDSFSILGAIGVGALLKIGSAAVEAGMRIVNNVMQPIMEGGKKRAINLEQANFQLMGILKSEEEVAKIMVNVGDAVDGTAYGLDAAAMAAAQFAASGMRAGKEMEDALKGISGVAAMSGASYEEISNIFTKVAGQGRLMGDDLNRLAARGINAAATMVDYFKQTGKYANLTEADIRKMVSEGKISFEEFAEAMNMAFGEHATAANETYAGSLANVKAALARIGAEYFIIEHEKMRKIFNALRPVINAFKKALDPLFAMYQRLYAIPMAKAFEAWGAAMEGYNFAPWIRPLEQFLVIGSTLKNVIASWVKPIGEAFSAIFKPAPDGGWLRSVEVFLNGFNRGLGGLAASEDQAAGVQNVFEGIFGAVQKFGGYVTSVFQAVGPVVQWLWDLFKVGLDYIKQGFEWIRPIIVDAFEALFGQEGKLTTFWENFQGKIEETGSVLETLGYYFQRLYNKYITPVIDAFKNFRKVLTDLKDDGLKGLGQRLETAFEPLQPAWEWLKSIGVGVGDFFDMLLNPIRWIKAQIPTIQEWLGDAFSGIADSIKKIGPALGGIFETIGGLVLDLGEKLVNLLKGVNIQELVELAEALGRLFAVIMLYKALKSLRGVGDSITGFFGEGAAMFKRIGQETKTDQFLKIAIALGILAAALWVLSKIPGDKLLQGAATLVILSGVLIGFVWAINKIEGGQVAKAAFGLGLMAAALLGLSAVLLILGLIPYDTLVQGGVALALMLGAVTVAAALMGTFGQHMLTASIGIALMAAALTLLIVPIQILGEMDLAVLNQGMYALGLALLSLTVAAMLISANGQTLLLGAIGMALMAGALTLLIIPIQTLGAMPYAELEQGLGAVLVALLALVAASAAMQFLPMGAIGLIVISAALVILAAGISILAAVPFESGAMGLILLAAALGIIIIAAGATMAVLPGVLGLAGLMLAFGIAAILVGAAAILFATGLLILSAALPALGPALSAFLEHVPGLLLAGPALILIGGSLAIFGAGALVAGIGGMVLAIALALMGRGLEMIAASGPSGTAALLALVDAIKPLVWDAPAIGVVAIALGALGAAILVLGVGLMAAGVGGVLFGLGAIAAGVGIAIFVGLSALVAPLAERISVAFSTLQAVIPVILSFNDAILRLASSMITFAISAMRMLAALSAIVSTLTRLASGFMTAGNAAMVAGSRTMAAMQTIGVAIAMGASLVSNGIDQIVAAFLRLAIGIVATGPRAAAAATTVMNQIAQALVRGASVVTVANNLIVRSFEVLGKSVLTTGLGVVVAVAMMSAGLQRELRTASTGVVVLIALIVAAFARLSAGIRQNGSAASKAVTSTVSLIVGTLVASRGLVYNAAYAVGTAMGQGMSRGLQAQSGKIASQARNMATAAVNAAKNALEIKSPSRKFMALADLAVDGFIIPFHNRVSEAEDASSGMGNAMLDAVNATIQEMESQFTDIDQWGMSPVITPVLDLDRARGQMRGFGGTAALEGDFGRSQASNLALLDDAIRRVDAERGESGAKQIQFVQHNTSPKALSEAEIYRRTKNLISNVERKE